MQTTAFSPSVNLTSVGPRPKLTNLVLLTSDIFGLAFAVGIGNLVGGASMSNASYLPIHIAAILLVLPLLFFALRLYPGAGLSPIDEMRILVIAISATFAVLGALFAVAAVTDMTAYMVIGLTWLIAILTVTSGRVLVRHVFADRPWWGVPVLALGAGRTAELVISRLRTNSALNLKVVECLDDDPRKIGTYVAGVPVSGALVSAAKVKSAKAIDYAIVVMPGLEPAKLSTLVQDLSTIFSNVVVVPNTFGMTSVGVGTRDSGGIIGLYVRGHLSLRSNLIAKRVIDLILMVPLGLLAAPIIMLCALAVFLFSPGNPFYAQEREGHRGKRFRLWKIRTMHQNGQEILDKHLQANPQARREWETHFKLEDDPRVIPFVGTFLRRSSLDELPQILNIARGEMSFVGPRPFPIYHLDQFEPDFRRLRASVVPGLTGYWQVTSRSTADLVMQVELDSYYITNWSLWFDLYALARTPWAVIFGTGAR